MLLLLLLQLLLAIRDYIFGSLGLSCVHQQDGNTHTHAHTRLTTLFLGLPGWASTRKLKPISGFYSSKRQWVAVAVASAGPYASLHLAPDRQPHQHPTTLFFTGQMPFLPPNQQHQSTAGTVVIIRHEVVLPLMYYLPVEIACPPCMSLLYPTLAVSL